jgi:hypothetical protein
VLWWKGHHASALTAAQCRSIDSRAVFVRCSHMLSTLSLPVWGQGGVESRVQGPRGLQYVCLCARTVCVWEGGTHVRSTVKVGVLERQERWKDEQDPLRYTAKRAHQKSHIKLKRDLLTHAYPKWAGR